MRTLSIAAVILAMATAALAQAQDLELSRWDKFTLDDSLKRDGRPTFLWPDIAENVSVKCYSFPDENAENPNDLTPYSTLKFWMHVQEPKEQDVSLILRSENPETEGSDYYYIQIPTDFQGWREFKFVVPLLRYAREPLGLDNISQIIFSSSWTKNQDPSTVVHFQDIVLSRTPIPGLMPEEGEVLTNRSFEIVEEDRPPGYTLSNFNSDAQIAMDDKVAHRGEKSVRIDGVANARAGISRGIRGEGAEPGKTYVLSAWIKLEDTSKHKLGNCARLTYVGDERKVLKTDHFIADPGPSDWKHYQWEYTVPEGTKFFNLVLFHHGEGKAWWDDVSIKAK